MSLSFYDGRFMTWYKSDQVAWYKSDQVVVNTILATLINYSLNYHQVGWDDILEN